MRYVIIRDDDTNALTPAAYLEKLYRPFLDRGLFVNLATIPHVRTDAKTPNGDCEGFLPRNGKGGRAVPARRVPIGNNQELIDYLKANPGFNIVQHGCDHSCFEFDSHDATDIAARLDEGRFYPQAGTNCAVCQSRGGLVTPSSAVAIAHTGALDTQFC
ncbi:MAG: hypothetical protein L0Y58_13340 [Verrucomicrobia subdivision 3 bacterium]|nr:hypothetical protein [Limisphaerales bacterium]